MFRLFLLLVVVCMTTSVAYAEELQPGDKGYRHDEMHPYYQKLFNAGKCNCHTGECRPTVYRLHPERNGDYQVKLNGDWIDVPKESIQYRNDVPPELWADPAHICAFPVNGRIKVECAIINAGF